MTQTTQNSQNTTPDSSNASQNASPAAGDAAQETPFQADVARLLDLVVHSVYSDQDIFLRELISNAADACEKLRFETVAAKTQSDDQGFRITLEPQKDRHELIIEDNGVGMSEQELASSLGVIANSGTRAFLEQAAQSAGKEGDHLIGRFGIGFYSAFIVADRVEVFTRRAGQPEGWKWTSDGKGTYSISPTNEEAPARGARIILHLKKDCEKYADPYVLETIVKEHSAGIPIPIYLKEPDGKEKQLSNGLAIWTRPKSEVTPEQYAEFYRTISGHFDEPALTIHWRAEGRHEFDALVFIPSSRPFDLFSPQRRGHGRLYVRHVLVSSEADLTPSYLRFAVVTVDSADVPLNVSRELVQKSPILGAIRKAVTGRTLQELAKFSEAEPEKYKVFWKNFGAVLKEGLYEDPERRDAIFALARFATSAHPGGERSLPQYMADLRPNQTAIYYLTGVDADTLASSPHLEGFRARGVEVLLLSDPVDSFWVGSSVGFDGKPFKSASQGEVDLQAIPLLEGKTAPAAAPETAATATGLARLKETLAPFVSDVRASNRLSESAACLVASETGMDRTLAKMLSETGRMPDGAKPVLEVNLSHPLVRALVEDKPASSENFKEAGGLLFDLARLADGELPVNSAEFSRRMSNWAARAYAASSKTEGDHQTQSDDRTAEASETSASS